MTEAEPLEESRALFLKLGADEVLRAYYKATGNYSAIRALAKSRRLEKCRAQNQRVRERIKWMKNRNECLNARASELERERAATPEELDELYEHHLWKTSPID